MSDPNEIGLIDIRLLRRLSEGEYDANLLRDARFEIEQIDAIREAAEPFFRVMRMQEPLNLSDETSCRDAWPGLWPTMGDMRKLLAAIGDRKS